MKILNVSAEIVWNKKKRRKGLGGGGRHVARMGERGGVYKVIVEKPEEKRSLGTPGHRREGNVKMDLQEVECGGMN